jgi:iron complex outermembrane receptor protein
LAVLASVLLACTGAALGQHSDDNAIVSADDGFGLTLGRESVGIYNPGYVRGFNPQVAGDARIDGLFFDQQGNLSNRVLEGSVIRVGISEIGYSFPAPTGIVDYDLKHPEYGALLTTVTIIQGPYSGYAATVDASVPLDGKTLQLPIGASAQLAVFEPGYSLKTRTFAAAPVWKPLDGVTVRAFVDVFDNTDIKTLPTIFTEGSYLPPNVARGYYGQDWATSRAESVNFGTIVEARLPDDWFFKAGIFRSVSDSPVSYADLYVDTLPTGFGEHLLVGSPDQWSGSTSGEARLLDRFTLGPLKSEWTFMFRGRDTPSTYGGSDVVDAGQARIDRNVQVPIPDFVYSATTKDITKLSSVGTSYRGNWAGLGEFAVGLQKEAYTDSVLAPNEPVARISDDPWRAYETLAVYLGDKLAFFAGGNQGLESSGSAPSNADNRGEILPVARTSQLDGGVRYAFTKSTKLIICYFEVNKPYFNLDENNVDRDLGSQDARGIEVSFSGEVVKNLKVVAGGVVGSVTVNGDNLAAQGIGTYAFGQPRNYETMSANYAISCLPGFSLDGDVSHWGKSPASTDDSLYCQALTQFDAGWRYLFKVDGKSASVRFQVLNLTNTDIWSIGYSPGFSQYGPRTIQTTFTIDL